MANTTITRRGQRKEVAPDARYHMSEDHKANLAVGREQARVVRAYLQGLQDNQPKRGRKVTPESLEARLEATKAAIDAEGNPVRRLELISERDALQSRLDNYGTDSDLTEIEAEFIGVAAAYGRRRGISYAAWREVGVQPAVLKAAGIGRAS